MTDWIVSSDSHLVEPPNLYVERIDRKFRDSAPRVEVRDGHEWMCVENLGLEVYVPARAGDRFLPLGVRRQRRTFAEDVRPGAYDPSEWLAENQDDGVYAGTLIPSHALIMYGVKNSDLLSAILRVWNDWVLECASVCPSRLKAIGALNVDDVDYAARELRRLRAAGVGGVLIPVRPLDTKTYDDDDYEPLWAAAEETATPLLLHVATARPQISRSERQGATGMICTTDYWVKRALTSMIFAGVFERHPALRMVSVENEGGWAPSWLRRMDWHYLNNFRLNRPGYMVKLRDGLLPSDLARRNVMISFCEDDILVTLRHEMGVDQLMWSTDYPHAEGLFPRSRQLGVELFGDIPCDERAKLIRENAIRLFGFNESEWRDDPAYVAGPREGASVG